MIMSMNCVDETVECGWEQPNREMPPYTVRCVSVAINRELREQPLTMMDTLFRGQPRATSSSSADHRPPLVKLNPLGPLAWVTLLGTFVSIALFVVSTVCP